MNKEIRLCFFCGDIYPLLAGREDIPIVGGAEVQQYLIAKELVKHGFQISFVTEDYGQGKFEKIGSFAVFAYDRHRRNKLKQALSIWQALRKADADIYYLRGVSRLAGILWYYCQRYGKKLVFALSSNHDAHRGKATRLRGLYLFFYYKTLAEASAIITQTEYQRGLLRQNYGLESVVIKNAMELYPDQEGIASDKAIWIGTMIRYKGVEVVFELARRMPEVRFEIIGGPYRNDRSYFAALQEQASQIPNVDFRGFVPFAEVSSRLKSAFVLLNTTIANDGVENIEGFPNTYLQAWRMGIPTVTLQNDPNEIISRHKLGFHSKTVEQMAGDIRRLYEDESLRRTMGNRAREYFAREHDIKTIIHQYIALFTQLMV